jgi:hypothetical protein
MKKLEKLGIDEQFDKDLNLRLMKEFTETQEEHKIQYRNPLRDYAHLLSNRLVSSLISLATLLSSNPTLKDL